MEPATPTARAQRDLETRIASIYRDLADLDAAGRVHRVHRGDDALCLQRGRHARYAGAGLGRLPASFASLDASRPWICFWVLHSLALLGAPLPEGIAADDVVAFLGACAAEGGGYGGGPGQMAHLAPTYAAVAALLTLGGEAAYESIDRAAVAAFLRRMAVPPERGGGFTMHEGGEADARACYTAVAVASMLNLDVESLAAASGVVDYLQRCQTYEGGLGGCPGNEAHGGYTYCGAAALALLDALPALDLPRLARWLAQRQGTVEGGFNGRTNKLVDGCYSFWQGAALPLVARERARLEAAALRPGTVRPGDLDLDVPPLPPLPGVATPYDEAVREAARLSDRAEELVARAVAAEAAVLKQQEQRRKAAADEAAAAASAGAAGATAASSDGDGRQQQQQQQPQQQQQQEAAPERKASTPVTSPRSGTDAEREARRLLRKAEEAQRASEEADLAMEIAQYSAAQLFVCFGPDGTGGAGGSGGGGGGGDVVVEDEGQPAAAAGQQQQQQRQQQGEVGASGGDDGGDDGEDAADSPLFDAAALQVWLLKGCQQPLKGGLRDKPGKPPDYYHTCYCLSGLSVAQYAAGGGRAPLGGGGNEVARTDLLVNVVEGKAAAARDYFGALPAV